MALKLLEPAASLHAATKRTGRRKTTQTCAGSQMCLARTPCRSCFLRGPGGSVTTLPSRPQARHGSPASSTNSLRATEQGQQLRVADRRREGTDKNSHLRQHKYPWCPPFHFADSYMFTLSTGTSRPPISNPPAPRRTLESWGQRDSCTPEPCVQGSRQGAYLSPKPCSGINILNPSPGHGRIFTAKFPLVICL